jgi:cell division cycle protein 20 (cofactor of APC complex)
MATVDVCTPIKGRVFTTKVAGGRMPLTPSPKQSSRLQQPRLLESPPSIHATPAFAQGLPKSAARKSTKSNIALANSPKRLDAAGSEWTLTGTGNTPSKPRQQQPQQQQPLRTRAQKPAVRIAYNAADRFLPNRAASEGLCNVGVALGKLDLDRPSARPKSRGLQDGSSILASGAGAFDIGGRGSDDDVACERDDDSDARPKPAPDAVAYESSLASACGVNLNTRILAFKPAPPESNKPIDLRSQYNRPLKPANAVSGQFRRRILTSPERVLDAPNIVDDYYLNVLDWSCHNQVAIGLGQSVYVWSADSGSVSSLLETSADTYISSLKWSNDGAYVSVGLATGEVQIWDVEDQAKVRSMHGHESRVGVMSEFTVFAFR